MSFAIAEAETRERFGESRILLAELRRGAPPPLQPVTQLQKAQRGLWLVSLYAAVERSVNASVEAALNEISAEGIKSADTVSSLHSIFHFPKVQSLHSCGRNSIFEKSIALLSASAGDEILRTTDNPLAPSLQNVDSKTMLWVLGLFGASAMSASPAALGRTNTLRERRNAVAHGRESAANVGERYTITELENMYNAGDEVVTAFSSALKDHCTTKSYLRTTA
ncbi:MULTISPECIES: MAE_28990/MAE_18760 family HEPN-like nuclease [Phaeobacter]|uniref:HEPN domain-containing protein n=1 Tax=Phaeobacter TaxID=302485 RepID=UPI00103AE7EF|nr:MULTISPECIES: MAE_28990/MAE_18760 family HEPN-like nuclease [Phaeobacter]UTS80897.1 hypothetical protein OL67_001968 [Phaeobacter piscinae]